MIIKNNNIVGKIFDIQGLSVHDGPGCRTLIFFKGCSLHCFWCSNPEGISCNTSLMYFRTKCITCGNCIKNCRYNAIKISKNKLTIERKLCINCENKECINECYTQALKICGYEITSDKLFEIIKRDRQFWGNNGGVTLTGGEPLLQPEFASDILLRCYSAYIHTAIETCGNVPWNNISCILPYTDWIFYDIKHICNNEHKKATNATNTLILENAVRLSKKFKGRLIFRYPLIPEFNDSKESITKLIEFIKETGKNELNILPLHHLGREKYKLLGEKYYTNTFIVPSASQLLAIKQQVSQSSIICYLGAETPY